MSKSKKRLRATILIVALFQMSQLTLNPAIDTIAQHFFGSDITGLAKVQEAFAITSFVAVFFGIFSAFLVNKGAVTKRFTMIGGIMVLGFTGVFALFFHTEFWHLQFMAFLIGVAMGTYITNTASIFFDNFTDEEREPIAGYQTSCINAGGIFWNLAGGIMCTVVWYGGYLMLMLAIPLAVLAWFTVPKVPRVKPSKTKGEGRAKLPPMIYFYCIVLGVFMAVYNVTSVNLSTHLAQAGSTNTAMAGFASAAQMAGGVCCGLMFGKLSAKLGDMLLVAACLALVIGYALLGLFPNSIVITFIAVFIAGMSLSCTAPRVMFAVSALADERTSATASAIANSVAPSIGAFISPYIFTRLTMKLFGEATGPRYLFTGGVAVIFGVVLTIFTLLRRNRGIVEVGATAK